jgi:hypothetical protein
VVKPEVYSVGFSGNGQITLKKNNPNNDIYQNNGDTVITNPVWIKGVKNDPVAFKMKTRMVNVLCAYCNNIFSKSNQLVYVGNRYEAFFGVNTPNLTGYTVYPAGGPFISPYIYLRVLNSVTNMQYRMLQPEGNLDNPTQTLIICPHCGNQVLYNAEVVPLIPVP